MILGQEKNEFWCHLSGNDGYSSLREIRSFGQVPVVRLLHCSRQKGILKGIYILLIFGQNIIKVVTLHKLH